MEGGGSNAARHPLTAQVVFFLHPLRAWEQGVVVSVGEQHAKSVAVVRCKSGETVEVALEAGGIFVPTTPGAMDSYPDDLLELPVLHDALLLHALRMRHAKDLTYMHIGEIVLSVNPFKVIPPYMDKSMGLYLEHLDTTEIPAGVPPHVWCVAHRAYVDMRETRRNHSIITSGESGSGKTEACKKMLKYLCAASQRVAKDEATIQRMQRITERVQMTNIILESFGNAKTVKNDNSSRFGKFMELQFDATGVMVGLRVTPFLLERSRVVTCGADERVYHVFFQLVAGAGRELRERLRVWHARDFVLLSRGGCASLKGNGVDDAGDFQILQKALAGVLFSLEEQCVIWSVIGSILHLQNIVFEMRKIDDSAYMRDEDVETALFVATHLLQLPQPKVFVDCLITCVVFLGGERLVRKLTVQRAKDQLDGICKLLYSKLFNFIIHKINTATAHGSDIECTNGDRTSGATEWLLKDSAPAAWIALLDIFGFEDFPVNSLEQFCINLTNEALQREYTERMFVTDMEEMRAEGVEPNSTEFIDNQPCLALLQGSRNSIISFLDDASMLDVERSKSNPDYVFLNAITSAFCPNYQTAPGRTRSSVLDRNENMESPSAYFYRGRLDDNSFTIRHYAGDVKYCVNKFVEKNNDFVRESCTQALQGTTSQILQELLATTEETIGLLNDVKSPNSPVHTSRGSRRTVASNFRGSLRTLMEVLGSSNCNWVRCIRPHSIRQPGLFDGKLVLEQLVSTGVLSTITQRQRNYPFRLRCEDFLRHYYVLLCHPSLFSSSSPLSPRHRPSMTLKEKCSALLVATNTSVSMARVGKTRVFLTAEAQRMLESMRLQQVKSLTVVIYRYVIPFLSRKYVHVVRVTQHVIRLQRIYRTSLRIRRCILQYYQELRRKRHERFMELMKSTLRSEAIARLGLLEERESYMRCTWREFRIRLVPLVADVIRNLRAVEARYRNDIALEALSQYNKFGEAFAQEAATVLEREKERLRIKHEMHLRQRTELLMCAVEAKQDVVREEQSTYAKLWEDVIVPGTRWLREQAMAARRFNRWRDKRLQELYAARASEQHRLAVEEAETLLQEEERWRTIVGDGEYLKEMRYFRFLCDDKYSTPPPLYALLRDGVPSEVMRTPVDSSRPTLFSMGAVTSFRDYREYMRNEFRRARASGMVTTSPLHQHCDGVRCRICSFSSYPLLPRQMAKSSLHTNPTQHEVRRRLLEELSDSDNSFDELAC